MNRLTPEQRAAVQEMIALATPDDDQIHIEDLPDGSQARAFRIHEVNLEGGKPIPTNRIGWHVNRPVKGAVWGDVDG